MFVVWFLPILLIYGLIARLDRYYKYINVHAHGLTLYKPLSGNIYIYPHHAPYLSYDNTVDISVLTLASPAMRSTSVQAPTVVTACSSSLQLPLLVSTDPWWQIYCPRKRKCDRIVSVGTGWIPVFQRELSWFKWTLWSQSTLLFRWLPAVSGEIGRYWAAVC